MLVIIKSAPQTDEAQTALQLAKDTSADIVLVQNGIYAAMQGELEGFKGTAYMLEDDVKLRGNATEDGNIKTINYAELVSLMAEADKVVGMI